jgi:hypothetical protein
MTELTTTQKKRIVEAGINKAALILKNESLMTEEKKAIFRTSLLELFEDHREIVLQNPLMPQDFFDRPVETKTNA